MHTYVHSRLSLSLSLALHGWRSLCTRFSGFLADLLLVVMSCAPRVARVVAWRCVGWTCVCHTIAGNPTPPAPAPHATTHAFIWPLPQAYTKGTATATLQVSRTFFSQGDANSSFLTQAFERYTRLTFPHATAAAGVADAAAMLTGLTVSVDDLDDSHPQIDTKEDYTLDIPASGVATLHASTVYGALRGLETFSQLVVFNFESGNYGVSNAPWSVTDSPRFPHRGPVNHTLDNRVSKWPATTILGLDVFWSSQHRKGLGAKHVSNLEYRSLTTVHL